MDIFITDITLPALVNLYRNWLVPSGNNLCQIRDRNVKDRKRLCKFQRLEATSCSLCNYLQTDLICLVASFLGEQEENHLHNQTYNKTTGCTCDYCHPYVSSSDWFSTTLTEALSLATCVIFILAIVAITVYLLRRQNSVS